MTISSVRGVHKPSSRACLSCRTRHLRCDGGSPRCVRCTESGSDCAYVQSRRGKKKDHNATDETITPALAADSVRDTSVTSSAQHSAPHTIQPYLLDQFSYHSPSENTGSIPRIDDNENPDDDLIDTYYLTVHPAHPFLLPYTLYQQDRSILPELLQSAMRYIASHHTSHDPEKYRKLVDKVYHADVPDDGFKVQILLLLTLVSYARFERDVGNKALSTACDVALRINLNSDHFARNQNSTFQESWRRTWWELFTVSGLISLISGSNYRLPLPSDMVLPAHDEEYEACSVNVIGTDNDMQRRFLSENHNDPWSSFAYRIEAMRILNTVQDLATTTASDDEVEAAKASIISFLLSVPKAKAEGLKKNGEVDEVMSCALMVIHLASICLHLGRSDLGSVRGLTTVCGTERGRRVLNGKSRAHHVACLGSAKSLANLITTRSSLQTLSPCFSCALAFAAVVQLAECRLDPFSQARYLKEQLKMQLSALKLLGNTWPIANVVRGQLAQFSREIFPMPSATYSEDAVQPNVTEEIWMQELLSEDLQGPAGGFMIPGMGQHEFE